MFNNMKLRHWLDDFCRRYELCYTATVVDTDMPSYYRMGFTLKKRGKLERNFDFTIDLIAYSEEKMYKYIITKVLDKFVLNNDQIVKSTIFPELNKIEKDVYDSIFKRIQSDILAFHNTSKIAPVISPQPLQLSCNISSYIEKVIFNPPATIVIWTDGAKTVVKCDTYDIYDAEKGLAMAISKRALGNEGNYYEVFKKWLPEKQESAEAVCGECRYFLNDICSNFALFNDDKRRAICKGFDEKISDEDNRYLARVCLNRYIKDGQLTKEDYDFSKKFRTICDELGIKFDEEKMDLDNSCGNCLHVNDDEITGRCKDYKAIYDTASGYKWVFDEEKEKSKTNEKIEPVTEEDIQILEDDRLIKTIEKTFREDCVRTLEKKILDEVSEYEEKSKIERFGCKECEKLEIGKISGLAACTINGRYIPNIDKCPKKE